MSEINSNENIAVDKNKTPEFLKLGESKNWLDEFHLVSTEITDLYIQTMVDANVPYTEYKDKIRKFTKFLSWIEDEVNELSDDILDVSVLDGWNIDIDNNDEEARALAIFKKEIVDQLNKKIQEQLKNVSDLTSDTYSILKDNNLLDWTTLAQLETKMQEAVDNWFDDTYWTWLLARTLNLMKNKNNSINEQLLAFEWQGWRIKN